MSNIDNLKKENKLINLFCTLAEIPSPSGEEDKVAEKIVEILTNSKIEAGLDDFGNVRAKIYATDTSKKPLALSAHMDVVGNNSEVNIQKSPDNKFYMTDGTRTLGADDKAGVAVALNLAIYFLR